MLVEVNTFATNDECVDALSRDGMRSCNNCSLDDSFVARKGTLKFSRTNAVT